MLNREEFLKLWHETLCKITNCDAFAIETAEYMPYTFEDFIHSSMVIAAMRALDEIKA